MLSQDEQWLLEEKYKGEKSAPVFNESLDEIKNKYPWGAAFFADCERLAVGEPLGYIIGHVPFLGCKIWLDDQPLIPRPETEFWVEKAIAVIKNASPGPALGLEKYTSTNHRKTETTESEQVFPVQMNRKDLFKCRDGLRVLDLCAGSGAIGIAVAKAIPAVHVTFGEIDANLLATIGRNLEENDIPCARYQVFQSDLLTNISGRFDFILCNPPYIDPTLDRTEDSVKDYEPHLALYGGKEGIELIKHIIEAAPAKLKSHGQLWLEHEPEQTAAIHDLATFNGFTVTTHTDQYNTERYSILVLQ